MNSRIEWIDALRGIGIVLVVFGHVWRGLDGSGLIDSHAAFAAVDQSIYLFHMPFFFFLSGLLFESSIDRYGIRNSFLRRIESLIYPFLLWSYVSAFILFSTGGMTNRGQLSLYDVLAYPWPPKDVYWFLAALFVAQTVASLSVPLHSARIYFACFIILSIPNLLSDFSGHDVWLQKTIQNTPFLFLGMACSKHTFSNRGLALAAFAAFFGAEIVQFFWISTQGAVHYLLSCLAAISFAYATAWALQRPGAGAVQAPFAALGKASMGIYVTHVIALAATRIILSKLGVHALAVHLILGVSAGVLGPYLFHVLAEHFRLLRPLGLGRDRRKVTENAAST